MFKKAENLCKSYKKEIDNIVSKHNREREFIDANFAGSLKVEKTKESDKEFEASRRKAMQNYIDEGTKIVSGMRADIKSRISVIDTKAMQEIASLRGLELSGNDIMTLTEKYKGNYYAIKSLKQLANEQGYRIDALSVDGMLLVVDKLENELTKIAYYAGNEFANDSIVKLCQFEKPFANLEEEYSSMDSDIVSVVKDEVLITPERIASLNILFEGYENSMEDRAKELVELGMEKVISASKYRDYLPK